MPSGQFNTVVISVSDILPLDKGHYISVNIDPDNWRLGLKVAPSQKTHVADSATLLARAYAYRDCRSRAFVIYDDETPVGMGLYYDLPEMECYDLSQLFIDERY